jgi:hypothetical protein
LLDELGDELSYAFGGCTITQAMGKYRSDSGVILPDKISLLFTDTPFLWDKDRDVVEQYAEKRREVVDKVLEKEEAILIVVYPVQHVV